MENQLPILNFTQAILMKELGFDWLTNAWFAVDLKNRKKQVAMGENCEKFNHNLMPRYVSRPTISHALMWCREVHEIYGHVYIAIGSWWIELYDCDGGELKVRIDTFCPSSHDAAESALLDSALAIIKWRMEDKQ